MPCFPKWTHLYGIIYFTPHPSILEFYFILSHFYFGHICWFIGNNILGENHNKDLKFELCWSEGVCFSTSSLWVKDSLPLQKKPHFLGSSFYIICYYSSIYSYFYLIFILCMIVDFLTIIFWGTQWGLGTWLRVCLDTQISLFWNCVKKGSLKNFINY